jgi:hypothetical protein
MHMLNRHPNPNKNRSIHQQALAVLLLTASSACLVAADNPTTFEPSKEFRMITFAGYGGGPPRVYQADAFSETVELYKTEDLRIIFTVSKPPTTATPTTVAGLFALVWREGSWVVTDSRRFEAIGEYSGAKAESTQSERAEPHVSLTLFQGGKGHSFAQCASYIVKEGKFYLDAPQEKPTGQQGAAGPALFPSWG